MKFLAAAVLLAWSTTAVASTPETTIIVTVTNQYDKPVDNAAVILDFLGSHQAMKLGKRKKIHWEAHTNLHGIAHFPPVPQGMVQVQVVTSKYQTYGEKFDLDADEKKIDVKLNAPQKQYSAHGPLKPADQPAPSDSQENGPPKE